MIDSIYNTKTRNDGVLISDLRKISLKLKKTCISISAQNKIPHLGSCLSCADLLTVIYWHSMNINPNNSEDPDRDRFLLSKGHASPIYIQALALKGFISKTSIKSFGQNGSFFHEHPPRPGFIKGVEAATGSLGHGFSMALGMAKAAKIQGKDLKVYTLLGDGECNEGVIWECAMLAPKLKVNNLIAIIDYNKLQATGRSQEISAIEPLDEKWKAFGWHTQTIDGHDIMQIKDALDSAKMEKHRPSMIIANTVKGKGISFMEDNNNWHYRTPDADELALALKELDEKL